MIQHYDHPAQLSYDPFTSSTKQSHMSRPVGAVAGSSSFAGSYDVRRQGSNSLTNTNRSTTSSRAKGKMPAVNVPRTIVIPPAPTMKPPTPPTHPSPTSPSQRRPALSPLNPQFRHPSDAGRASTTYARLLLPKGQGYPLYNPRPRPSLPTDYRKTGVRIGDVGMITADGSFDFLFNISLPASDPINNNSVPEEFNPIEVKHCDIRKGHVAWPAGSHFISGSVSATKAPVTGTSDGRYRFECRAEEGAILALPEGAMQEDLVSSENFSDYAGENAIHWYTHARAVRGGQATNGSLYLVTGYDKAKSWGTASFSNVQGPEPFSLNFENASVSRMPDSYAYRWGRPGHAATREGPPIEYFPGYKDRPQNQTVFIRGFKIMLTESVWQTMLKQASITPQTKQGSPTTRPRSNSSPLANSGPDRPRPPAIHRPSTSTSTGHRNKIPNGATVILNSPAMNMAMHPSNTINLHLLTEMQGARVAITHDSLWCSALDDDAATLPDTTSLLDRIKAKYEPTVKDGVVYFKQKAPPPQAEDRSSSGSKASQHTPWLVSDDGRRSSTSSIPRSGLGFGRQKAKAAMAAAERAAEGTDPDTTFSEDSMSIRTAFPETRGVDSLPVVAAYQAKHPNRLIPKLGPWLLLRKLGDSDGPRVRLGVHVVTGIESAVKLIRREKGNPTSQLRAIEKELRALQTLKHPNIVRLLDVVETDKYIAAMLEYTEGGELIDYILSHQHLKEREAARLFSQLISGVWYMHQKRVVHRNIKLETLVLDSDRNLLINDFEYVHFAEHLGDEFLQTSCGAPLYAAPEIVLGQKLYLGPPVDVWACGIVLYGMLAGFLPFDDDPENPGGDNTKRLYEYIQTTPVHFPKHIPALAQDLLRRMLAPDPAERISVEDAMQHPWTTTHVPIRLPPEGEPMALLEEPRPVSFVPTAFGYRLEELEMRAEAKYKTRLQQIAAVLRAPTPKRLYSDDASSTRSSVKSHGPVRPHTSAGEKNRILAASPLSGVTAVAIDQAMDVEETSSNPPAQPVNAEAARRKTLPEVVQSTEGRDRKERNGNTTQRDERRDPTGEADSHATEHGVRKVEDGHRSPYPQRSSFKWARKAISRLKRKE